MFDIGFSEMMIIGVVALVVLGPERLPKVARTAGQWVSKLQRYVSDVKSDINRQMELEELRKLQTEVKTAASDLQSSFKSEVAGVQTEIESLSTAIDSTSTTSSESTWTDWDKVYASRRTRERITERRRERALEMGRKPPKFRKR